MHFLLLTFLTNHIIFDCKLGSCGLCLSNNLGQSHNLLVYCCFRVVENAPQGISHCLGMSYYVNFLGGLVSDEFHIK